MSLFKQTRLLLSSCAPAPSKTYKYVRLECTVLSENKGCPVKRLVHSVVNYYFTATHALGTPELNLPRYTLVKEILKNQGCLHCWMCQPPLTKRDGSNSCLSPVMSNAELQFCSC